MNRVLASALTVTVTSILAASIFQADVLAAKVKPCSPWPSCQDQGDGGGGGGPVGAPAPVGTITTDPIGNAISLGWTVPETPADGSDIHHYEVWFGDTTALDGSNFDTDGQLAERGDIYLANGPGEPEYFTVRDLAIDTTYYFAVRTVSDRGETSEFTAASEVTADTAADAGQWLVDNVVTIADARCCESTSVALNGDGYPAVAWAEDSTDEVWYAERDSIGTWQTELVFAGTFCMSCSMGEIMGFHFAPDQQTDTPTLLFRHYVEKAKKRRGDSREEQVVYAWRSETDGWVAEEVIRADSRQNDGIDGYAARFAMDHFLDQDSGDWIPTAAYITTPLWEDPYTTYRLVFSERSPAAGQPAQWNPSTVFECYATDASIAKVRLRRDPIDGSLHAMVQMANQTSGDVWVTLIHRPADGSADVYYKSGVFVGSAFAVDSLGKYYVAGRTSWDNGDMVLAESPNFQLSDPVSACQTPGPQGTFDVAEQGGVVDTFDDGHVEGPLIGVQIWSDVTNVELTADDGVNPPAVHVFGRAAQGNYEIAELRVLSRCPGVGWVLDAVDRPNEHDEIGNVMVSDAGMAWAYNYGMSFGHHYEVDPPDRMLLGERTGNACGL